MTFEISEEDRQLLILSLALCSLLRPGFTYACGETAKTLNGGNQQMFDDFRKYNADQVIPHHKVRPLKPDEFFES